MLRFCNSLISMYTLCFANTIHTLHTKTESQCDHLNYFKYSPNFLNGYKDLVWYRAQLVQAPKLATGMLRFLPYLARLSFPSSTPFGVLINTSCLRQCSSSNHLIHLSVPLKDCGIHPLDTNRIQHPTCQPLASNWVGGPSHFLTCCFHFRYQLVW